MIKSLLKYPIQFILLVLTQVFVLNNVQLSGYINPFLYIVFILWLPIETNKALVMLLAFFIGVTVDIFSDTLGMHAAASVFLAFVRPAILNFLAPRDGYEPGQSPTVSEFGFSWFLIYVSIATLLHHLFLFNVEVFRITEFFTILNRALLSSLFTIVLILIVSFFNYSPKENR